ncbi:hypothetical protein [Burkholderia glumae]|uniref:hypothetical protein n=1 Tax=Burkholderia glumae TaxID=337 RepID=UPI0014635234|nr:hypothetical protein [Burkholderia glumae]QJP69310.1 hypothetical protein HJC54_02640 [Burkholderia glumae]
MSKGCGASPLVAALGYAPPAASRHRSRIAGRQAARRHRAQVRELPEWVDAKRRRRRAQRRQHRAAALDRQAAIGRGLASSRLPPVAGLCAATTGISPVR